MAKSISTSVRSLYCACRSHWPAMLLVMIFAIIALWLSVAIPIFEGPDENEHFNYVTIIAGKHRLPTYSLDQVPEQKIQPPLYYAVGALLVGWIPLDNLDSYLIPNPHATFSRVEVPGNKNVFIHSRQSGQAWNGTELAVHLFRLFSVVLGTGTVIATYLLALETFKGERWLALGAMSLVAFNPQFVYLSALINTDNAVTLLSTLGLLLAINLLRRPPSLTRVACLGLIAGLAGLAKVTGLGVLGIGLLAVTLLAWRQRSLRYWWLTSAILTASAAIVGGWWYTRNWWLYRDPFLGKLLEHHFGEHPQFSTLGDWISPFLQAEASYWAVFGWLNIAVPEGFYRAFALFDRVGLIGLLLFGLRLLFQRRRLVRLEVVGLLLSWCILILGGLTNYVRIFGGLQGRHYFPMIASLSILLVLGWVSLLPRRVWPWFSGGLSLVLVTLSVAVPACYVLPRYTPPPTITAEQIPISARQTPRYFGDTIGLLGAEVEPGPSSPGQRVRVTLYWQSLKPVEANYSVFVHLLDREGHVVGQSNSYPAQGRLATSLWRSGEVIIDTHEVLVDWDTVPPTVARVDVGLYRFEAPGESGPRSLDEAGRPMLAIVGQTKIVPAEWSVAQPSVPLDVRFDGGILLTGYDLTCDLKQLTSRDALLRPAACDLTLYWDVTGQPSTDYQVFIQLWDWDEPRAGTVQVAGFDGPPVKGDYPTSWWEAGETIVDVHSLDWSGSKVSLPLQSGRYRLLVGLYRLDTGERLPAFHPDGSPLPDFALKIPLESGLP